MNAFLFTHYRERLLFACVCADDAQQLEHLQTCLREAFDESSLMLMNGLPIEVVKASDLKDVDLRQLLRDWDTQSHLIELLSQKPQLGDGERHVVVVTANHILRRELSIQNIPGVRLVASRHAPTAVKASETGAEVTKSNPETKVARDRTRQKLRAFGEVMRQMMDSPDYWAATESQRQQWQDLASAIRAHLEWAEDQSATGSIPRTRSTDDWNDWRTLAQIVEMSDELMRSGPLTPREVFACALAWAGGQKIKASPTADTESRSNPGTAAPAAPVHNDDFTMVNWFGTVYRFALGIQSSVVKALWAEWEKTGLGLHQQTIRNAVDPERDRFRMDLVFRKHPAFRVMIQQCGDGTYRLVAPAATPAGRVELGP